MGRQELRARLPRLQELAELREARRLLRQQLGGAEALKLELMNAGFVDNAGFLTTEEKPFNVFARAAGGLLKQPDMESEQEALGTFKEKFLICRNRPENDLQWDSKDVRWSGKASMSRRHRFLTTKDLHWQWFNPLVFGMAAELGEGCTPAEALKEVEEMKAAAMRYVEHSPGWSKEVGLFVNIFGHNNVNSLFIHIIDLSEVGPSYKAQQHKNCPLDAVVKLLQEEAQETSLQRISVVDRSAATKSSARLADLRGGFRGTGGATSLKEELVERVPVLRDAGAFREARRILREDYGGCASLKAELSFAGFIDEAGKLTTGTKPFNLFARIASGEMQQPGMEDEQAALQSYGERFVVCKNRPENDEHWDSEEPEWLGKASMAARHRFLTTKDLRWSFFNALTLGMTDESDLRAALSEAIQLLEDLRSAAVTYVGGRRQQGWSEQLGLYFHVFGHNSVNSLHLHMVDMKAVGPTFRKLEYKNCPLNAILKVLQEEMAQLQSLPCGLDQIEASAELLELNVGGELLAISEQCFLSWNPEVLEGLKAKPRDGQGHIFLDLPAAPVKVLLDALRMRQLRQQQGKTLQLRCVVDEDLRTVAKVLGFSISGPTQWQPVAVAVAGAALATFVALRRMQ